MADRVAKVFISATSKDLRSVRGLVRDALLSMGCLPAVQEHFPPDYRDVTGMLRDKISECDALIHIAGMRYGAEPDPASVPEGTPRRSYTQMEIDLARELKLEKVFTFVCPEDFPYDTEDEKGDPLADELAELQELQLAHRKRLLEQKELRYRVSSPDELATRVREMQLELAEVKGDLRRTRGKMFTIGAGIAVALGFLAVGVFWIGKQSGDTARRVEEIQAIYREDPDRIAERLKEHVRKNAEKHLSALEKGGKWPEVAELETARDRQLESIDELVEFIQEGLVGEADPVFVRAADILADEDSDRGGPENALAYLQAKRGHLLEDVDRLGKMERNLEERKREKLRSILLEAEIHEKAFEWDEALEDLRLVVEKAPLWWEGLKRLGNLARDRALWEEAEVILKKAHSVAEEEQIPASQDNFAKLLIARGENEEAERLYREALESSERLLGHDHLDTMSILNNLALLLLHKGEYEEAEPMFREALEVGERVFGSENSDTLAIMNNLALLFERKGEYEKAEPLYREVLEIKKRVLGRESPKTLITKNNLARLLGLKGEFEEAKRIHREALEAQDRVLGREHPDTLMTMDNLAGLLSEEGDFEEAEPLYRELLEIQKRVLGRDHHDTVNTMNYLALLFSERGESEEAEMLLREVLKIRGQKFGREDLDTLDAMNNLALLLEEKGEYKQAEPLYREAYQSSAKKQGEESPDTQSYKENWKLCLEAMSEDSKPKKE